MYGLNFFDFDVVIFVMLVDTSLELIIDFKFPFAVLNFINTYNIHLLVSRNIQSVSFVQIIMPLVFSNDKMNNTYDNYNISQKSR